jgi:hypothetical protein
MADLGYGGGTPPGVSELTGTLASIARQKMLDEAAHERPAIGRSVPRQPAVRPVSPQASPAASVSAALPLASACEAALCDCDDSEPATADGVVAGKPSCSDLANVIVDVENATDSDSSGTGSGGYSEENLAAAVDSLPVSITYNVRAGEDGRPVGSITITVGGEAFTVPVTGTAAKSVKLHEEPADRVDVGILTNEAGVTFRFWVPATDSEIVVHVAAKIARRFSHVPVPLHLLRRFSHGLYTSEMIGGSLD